MKKSFKTALLLGLFFSLTFSVFGQINQRVKSIYFENADSTTVRTNATNCGDCGFIYYNNQDTSNAKFRVYQDSVWYDLLGGGGGQTPLYFKNGLTKASDSTTVEWGGTLRKNTSIAQAGFNTTFTGAGKVTFSSALGNNSGLNVGLQVTNPSSVSDGDIWYNNSLAKFRIGQNGSSMTLANLTEAQTFGGQTTFTPTSALSGLNVGSFAGNPSALSNGDLWYNSTGNVLNARINGATVPLGSVYTATNGLNLTGNAFSWGGTLTGNTGIALGGFNVTYSGTGKVTYSPSATLSGLNVGSLAGDPSSLSNGDFWYNSTTNSYRVRSNGTTYSALIGTPSTNTLIYTVDGTRALLGSFGTYSSATATMTIGRLMPTPTATLPGLNVGSFSGNPSTLVNGDLWYNSTGNVLNARINGVTVPLGGSTTSPGGSNTQVQYNNSGVFGGDPAVTLSAGASTEGLTITGDGNTGSEGSIKIGYDNGGVRKGVFVPSNSNNSDMTIHAGDQSATTGGNLNITSGSGNAGANGTIVMSTEISGVGGGDITINSGTGDLIMGGSSTGNDVSVSTSGNITLTPSFSGAGFYLIIRNLPTTCAGAPTGAIANIAGVLNICP